MADLGSISLWIALALAAYSTIGSVAGKLRLSPALVESAQSAAYAAVLALLVATLGLVIAFISHDFEIAYVAAHSDLAMPNRFTWVAFYAGNEGSLLYIATILSIMSAVAIWRSPERFKDSLHYTTAVLLLTLTFFLYVTTVMANPFDTLPFVP
ncbi:MAG: heme lyase CcmF/NrfE family subunit, partial [Dehalococcoidia bacterium]